MDLEQFARLAVNKGATGFTVTDLAIDKNSGKVTAILHDNANAATVHARIEGNTIHFQSWDETGEAKPEAPHVSEAKQKAADEADAKKEKEGKA